MTITSKQCWDAMRGLAQGDETADRIPPGVVATLVRFKIVEYSASGGAQLTAYGRRCYEAGEGNVPELNELDVR